MKSAWWRAAALAVAVASSIASGTPTPAGTGLAPAHPAELALIGRIRA